MIAIVLITLRLIVLHSVDGYEVSIAPSQVTTLRAAKDDQPNQLFTEEVRCVISTTDGKLVTVTEKCSVVRQLLEETQR